MQALREKDIIRLAMPTPMPMVSGLRIPSTTFHMQHLANPSSYVSSRARFSTLLCNPFSPMLVFSHIKSATLTLQWELPANYLFPVSQQLPLPIKFTTTAPGGIFPVDEYPQRAFLRRPTAVLQSYFLPASPSLLIRRSVRLDFYKQVKAQ